jgi:hypothetical protein
VGDEHGIQTIQRRVRVVEQSRMALDGVGVHPLRLHPRRAAHP